MNRTLLEDRRVWLVGGAVVALLLVAASWLLLIGPKFSSAASLDSMKKDAQTSNDLIQAKNTKLAKEARNMTGLQNKLRTALAGLPGDSGFAEFTREVTGLAARNDIALTSISISPPAAPAATAAPTTSPDDGASTSAAPTTAAPSPAATAQTSAVTTISVTLSSSGSGANQDAFLKSLENGPRRVLVTSSQLSVGNGPRVNSVSAATTMTTQLTIFSAPMSAEQLKTIQQTLAAK